MADFTITIAIPTFNRVSKLGRLLETLDSCIGTSAKGSLIEVLVGDNASQDGTYKLLRDYRPSNYNLRVITHRENVGMDGNMRVLYDQARSDYVWFFSDDDLPKHGCIDKVYETLLKSQADCLLFEFEQPPGNFTRRLGAGTVPALCDRPHEIINALTKFPKITTYVIRQVPLSSSTVEYLDQKIGSAFWFIYLSLSIVQSLGSPKVMILPDFLAQSDRGYNHLAFPPPVWSEYYRVFTHSYVTAVSPQRWKKERFSSYCWLIELLYGVAHGRYSVNDPKSYGTSAQALTFRWRLLWRKPACDKGGGRNHLCRWQANRRKNRVGSD